MRIIFISEALSHPFDEGIKNVAFSLYKQLGMKSDVASITKAENNTDSLEISKVSLNKLFLNNKLRKHIKNFMPDVILYLPEASVTFNSFIRAKVLKRMSSKSRIVLLGVKHINYSSLQKMIIANFFKPNYLMLLGRFEMEFFLNAGMKVKVLPPAVDSANFCQVTNEEKKKIRAEFNVQNNKTVVLHVGHIRSTRNVECLLDVQRIDNVQVVIVGSTSTTVEKDMKDRLERKGIRVINKVVADISKIYKMSDIYVFPVLDKIACIDMPLSVLEALACNLPVITTRFGGLVEHFKEDAGFRYFDTIDELIKLVKLIKDMDGTEINNNKKVEPFTWGRFTDEIIAACNEAV
jgi:glycosyltransferase involved in cell wall biosynthesis